MVMRYKQVGDQGETLKELQVLEILTNVAIYRVKPLGPLCPNWGEWGPIQIATIGDLNRELGNHWEIDG